MACAVNACVKLYVKQCTTCYVKYFARKFMRCATP